MPASDSLTCLTSIHIGTESTTESTLPERRVRKSRPFEHIGLDYFGPLPVTLTDGSQGECYGAILTCMVTRIIHLDVACDLSRVLRRFFGRRGIPRTITSENAPTFTTGESILKDCVQALERNPTLSRELGNREIEWRHITRMPLGKERFMNV
ncbi:hypothetical protein Aduo_016057 [Ancylostoma duodenale]